MRYLKCTVLFLVLGAGTLHFSYFNAMNTQDDNLKNGKLIELGKLDSDFRSANGLSSPLLNKQKTLETLKRIAVGPTYSYKKFFENVSEGAEIYYGLAAGLKVLPNDQKTLYNWCRKVLSFVYAYSFIQRTSHDGPTDALFVIEDASVLKELFEKYGSKVLLVDEKKEFNEKLVLELNKSKKLPKNRIELTGPDQNEGVAYGMRLHFRKTEEQTHRKPLLGRFKEVGYAVRPDSSEIILKFYGEKISTDQAFINLGIVPNDCKEYFKANFGSEIAKLHGKSLMSMQAFAEQWMIDNPTKSDKADSFQKFLKKYAAKKRLTHLKKRTGNEIVINGKIELLVAAYLMQDPCVLAQNINESSSLIFDNKLSTEFSQVRGLFIMVQNLLDELDNAYAKGFLESIQPGDEIPSSNDLNASVLSEASRYIGGLSFMMREYCACCSAVLPSLKHEGVKDYFGRAALMIEKLLFDYKKDPRTVFTYQFFDSDSQMDFATQGIKSDVSNMIAEFYQKATKNFPVVQQDVKNTNVIATWKDLVVSGIEETAEQTINTNSFRDVLKQVFTESTLSSGLTDWAVFKEKCAQLLTGGEKNEKLMLMDTAIKNIIGHGDRSFVLDMQAFDSSIPGIFKQAAKKQKSFGNALLALVLKQIRQNDVCTGELRSKIDGTANSWKAALGQLANYFEKAGFYVSSGKKGSQLLEGVKLYVEEMVKKTMPEKSEKIVPLLCGKFLQDKQKLYIAFGDDAFRNKLLPTYQALTYQAPELKEMKK